MSLSSSYPEKWDTRVADIMGPDFRLVDELRTNEATIRDLLAHKMGYPSYGATWLLGLEGHHSRQEYCRSACSNTTTAKWPYYIDYCYSRVHKYLHIA